MLGYLLFVVPMSVAFVWIERGHERVAKLSWEGTARTFRAHYRRIACRTLTEEDHGLLATPPLL